MLKNNNNNKNKCLSSGFMYVFVTNLENFCFLQYKKYSRKYLKNNKSNKDILIAAFTKLIGSG